MLTGEIEGWEGEVDFYHFLCNNGLIDSGLITEFHLDKESQIDRELLRKQLYGRNRRDRNTGSGNIEKSKVTEL